MQSHMPVGLLNEVRLSGVAHNVTVWLESIFGLFYYPLFAEDREELLELLKSVG